LGVFRQLSAENQGATGVTDISTERVKEGESSQNQLVTWDEAVDGVTNLIPGSSNMTTVASRTP
jgi:hypothetical protein